MTRSRDIADQQKNLGGAVAPFVAGKNAVINGGMDIWSRGTSFTNPVSWTYTADRWAAYVGGNTTFAQESTIVPTGSRYSLKMTAGATIQMFANQAIETANALQYAGKIVTVSVQVAASNAPTLGFEIGYTTSVDSAVNAIWTVINATSGGSYSSVPSTFVTLSGVYVIPSTAKSLRIQIGNYTATVVSGTNFYIGQVQLEQGSIATPFTRAGGSIGGELALCQRYYWRNGGANTYTVFGYGQALSASISSIYLKTPVTMRIAPTSIDTVALSNYRWYNGNNGTITSLFLDSSTTADLLMIDFQGTFTAQVGLALQANNTTSAYIGFNSEL